MEKVKLSDLKKSIEDTKESISNPIQKDRLGILLNAIRVCPPQFLRITKMYEEVKLIKQIYEI